MAYYTGLNRKTLKLDLVKCNETPSELQYWQSYAAFIDPYKTKRAALWACKYGLNNPHFQHVRDAERMAKYEMQSV
jgi:hypothetical protein